MRLVLLVGEDANFRRFVRITLQQAGYAAAEARTPDEAASLLAQLRPSALVYDCALGDRGEVLRERLGEAGHGALPVLWVTSGLPDDRPVGPWALVKPFDPRELVGLLENVLQKPAA